MLDIFILKLPSDLIRSRLTAIETVNVINITEKIVQPVCLLQSIDDTAIPERSRKLLRRSLQRYEFHQLEGNHFVLQTQPSEAATAVSNFHRKLDVQINNEA